MQPARSIPRSEDAARRLVNRFDQALRTPGRVRLVMAEEEVTSYLEMNLRDAPVRDLSVWFTPGGIHLRAKVRAWREPTLQALVTVSSRNRRLQVQVEHAALNGRSLPRPLMASLQQAANAALADAHPYVRVEQVLLGEGFVIIVGSTEQGG